MSGVYLRRDGDLIILNLGSPEEKAVVFTEERMTSFSQAIDEVAKISGVKGLVIAGSSPTMFCAGADIHLIASVTDTKKGAALARLGQEIFAKIEALSIRTVAAISGPCVGGGFELALACDYRIASAHPSTKIGLPEVKIGIVPGFGGTQRLPKLIGIQKAIDLIVKAKVLPGSAALKAGLIDKLLQPFENEDEDSLWQRLLKEAKSSASSNSTIKRTPLGFLDSVFAKFPPARALVKRKVLGAIQQETKGQYPAPLRAVDCIFAGFEQGNDTGYLKEQAAIGDLVVSKESKALVHIFLVSEESQKIGRPLKKEVQGISVGVLGGGVMGAGIAASLSLSGFPVRVLEPIPAIRDKALNHIRETLSKKRSLSDSERKALLDSVVITDDSTKLADTRVIIEAIIEDLGIKREVLGKLSERLSPSAIIATNTSSLSVSDIGSELPEPSRILGLHYFNPAEKMPLVEVVRGKQTSDRTALLGAALAAACGKFPVIVEDVPGFLVNRILTPYLVEASHLLSQGFSVGGIDRAAVKFGMPMGPLRLLDEIGLDTAAKVSAILENRYGVRMKGHPYAEALVALGKLGKKNGSGFYIYDSNGSTPDPNLSVKLSITAPSKDGRKEEAEIQERLILAMVNEAVRCLDEGVAGAPGKEASGQIDLATVMGIGFPPFRGGILHYADSVGAATIFTKLKHLSKSAGERFNPSEGLQLRGEKALSFATEITGVGKARSTE